MIGPGSVTALVVIAGVTIAASILTYNSINQTELREARQAFAAALTFQLSSFSEFFSLRRMALHGVADSISATSSGVPTGAAFSRVSALSWRCFAGPLPVVFATKAVRVSLL